jgi:2-keto-4-pentenoate hydratase/2-oxohepta-3-ene-1,7-dioic acid hydratase in catechol pathway
MDLNDKTVQNGNSKDMIFSFEKIISYVSQFIYLKMGDILFSGTPAGVGKVNIGDRITAFLEDKKMLDFMIK